MYSRDLFVMKKMFSNKSIPNKATKGRMSNVPGFSFMFDHMLCVSSSLESSFLLLALRIVEVEIDVVVLDAHICWMGCVAGVVGV